MHFYLKTFKIYFYFWLCWSVLLCRGYSLLAVRGLLTVVSLVVEHRL